MSPLDLAPYVAGFVLIALFLVVQIRRDQERARTAKAELREKFFPRFLAELKALYERLGEEGIEGYSEIEQSWKKSGWLIEFRKYYGWENEAFDRIRQKIEAYNFDVRKFRETGDAALGGELAKERADISADLAKFIAHVENLT